MEVIAVAQSHVVALLFHNGICSTRQQGKDQKNALRPATLFSALLINIRRAPSMPAQFTTWLVATCYAAMAALTAKADGSQSVRLIPTL